MAANDTELDVLFQSAANYLKNVANKIEADKLLYLYGRFKQVKVGPCNVPKPRFYELEAKRKWEAWKQLGDMNQHTAMKEYISQLTAIVPDWQEKADSSNKSEKMDDKEEIVQRSMFGGVVVSTLYAPEESIEDHCKTAFDWCKEGNTHEVDKALANHQQDINALDEQGLALLHWASDRGLVDMVRLLLDKGAQVNQQDVDGLTPLHYGVSCSHEDVVLLLLSKKAHTGIKDFDGNLPENVAASSKLKQLLQTGTDS